MSVTTIGTLPPQKSSSALFKAAVIRIARHYIGYCVTAVAAAVLATVVMFAIALPLPTLAVIIAASIALPILMHFAHITWRIVPLLIAAFGEELKSETFVFHRLLQRLLVAIRDSAPRRANDSRTSR